MKNFKIILFLLVIVFTPVSFIYAEDEIIDPPVEVVEEQEEETEETEEETPADAPGSGEAMEEETEENEEEIVEEAEQQEFNFDITLTSGCEIQDVNSVTYTYPNPDSPLEYLAICVLQIAQENAQITSVDLIDDFGFGLYVKNINDIEVGATEYWALYLNGAFAECGIECLVISEGDQLSFILTDWMTNAESVVIKFNVTLFVEEEIEEEPADVDNSGEAMEDTNTEETEEEATEDTSTPVSSGGGGGGSITPVFSVPNAIAYLESVQDNMGSFGASSLYTDWASIALSANGINQNVKTKILNYMQANNTVSSWLLDNERRAMAILALGENPYSFFGVDYINPIVSSFDGTQLGDINLDNDDIFGLIVLPEVGYTVSDEIISKTISFILSAQNSDGSWDFSVDMTSASIQALKPFESYPGVGEALLKAKDYLVSTQQIDGSWGNASSTSWAMQAGAVLGVSFSKNGKTGLDYLASLQISDGSLLQNETLVNKIWATSYAVPAVLGKSWRDIMQEVSKPVFLASNSVQTSSTNTNDEDQELVEENKVDATEEVNEENTDIQIDTVIQEIKEENKNQILVTEEVKEKTENKTIAKKEVVDIEVEEDTEDTATFEIQIPSEDLSANTSSSGTQIPTPYIPGVLSTITLATLFIRKFI